MSSRLPDYDVFLSYDLKSRRTAASIVRQLQKSHISYFDATVSPKKGLVDEAWSALAECAAMLVVAGKSVETSSVAAIGAAMAWQKPVYVIAAHPKQLDLGVTNQNVHICARSHINVVIEHIEAASGPLTDEQRLVLARLYSDLNVPADQLARRPVALEQLTRNFNRKMNKSVSGTKLLREIIQLRKRGLWPSLRSGSGRETQVLVAPHHGNWAVRRSGGKRATSLHSTQREAIVAARRLAIRSVSDVVVHGTDGRIIKSSAQDPVPPKDSRG